MRPRGASLGRNEAPADDRAPATNEPEVLLLDEPTTGLDPQARHVVWDRLYSLKRRGVTLLLTTHYMEEAEQLCDRLVVMDKGKIVAEGSPRQPIKRYRPRARSSSSGSTTRTSREDFGHGPTGSPWVEPLPDRVLLYTDNGDAAAHGIHERGLVPTACSSVGARSTSCTSRAAASSSEGFSELLLAPAPAARVLLCPVPARLARNGDLERRHARALPARLRLRARRARGLDDRPAGRSELPRSSSPLASSPPRGCSSRSSRRAGRCSRRSNDRQYHAMLATPLRVGDVLVGHQSFIAFRC